MKAMMVTALGGPEVIQLQEVVRPEPKAGEVLIRVVMTSINFADIKARYGHYHGAGTPPFVPGLDVAGVIEELGAGVRGLAPGMRVIAFPSGGSYAEWVTVSESLVFPLLDAIAWDQAGALPIVAFTAYSLLTSVAELKPGESVLIHAAAGGVGTTAIQMAKVLQAGDVIGTVSTDAKAEVVRRIGADQVVPYGTGEFADVINRMTQGRGVDVILDSVGGRISEESLRCLAPFGRLVHFGSASGEVGRIAVSDLHASCRSVRGYSLGTVRRTHPERMRPTADAVLAMVGVGQVTMEIGRCYPLEEAAEAHRWVESRQSTGKVLLSVAAS